MGVKGLLTGKESEALKVAEAMIGRGQAPTPYALSVAMGTTLRRAQKYHGALVDLGMILGGRGPTLVSVAWDEPASGHALGRADHLIGEDRL